MPEIPDEFLKSVVFLLNPGNRPIGTAFVAQRTEGKFHSSFYLVTCEHCVESPVIARFANGTTLNVAPEDWAKSESRDDVVALDVTTLVNACHEIGHIETGLIVERPDQYFRIGTDIYMLGLYPGERDYGVNLPRARFGNLSAFADDEVLFKQGKGVERPCHLGDMRSRKGFSGSPVIGYLEIATGMSGHVNYKNRLFGLQSAQETERCQLVSEQEERWIDIPSSMTRIVPGVRIKELLEGDPKLSALRKARIDAANKNL